MATASVSTTTAGPVAVRCLGEFSLSIGGRRVERWRAGKARSLFQYLLVNRGQIVVRERLYDVLWPDLEWSSGSSSLKVAAHALRQLLRGEGGGQDTGVRLVHREFGYGLFGDDIWVDAEEFQALVGAGRVAAARGDTAAALRAYREAMELYRGDFLAGESATWVVEQREWHKGAALRALDELREDALHRDDYTELIGWCRRILEIEPYREETYQLLMEVHGRLGERERVKNWYQVCVRRLRAELGIEPTSDTHRVFAQALRGGGRPVRRPRPGLVPAGAIAATGGY